MVMAFVIQNVLFYLQGMVICHSQLWISQQQAATGAAKCHALYL
jgi:hypothetical protein